MNDPVCVLQLTPECRDLLNSIFQTDASRRITVMDIKEHAWYRKPLLGKYQVATDKIEALQVEHDEYTRHRQISSVSPLSERLQGSWGVNLVRQGRRGSEGGDTFW